MQTDFTSDSKRKRSPTFDSSKPYRLLSRELTHRMGRKKLTRSELTEATGMARPNLDAILSGYRPLPAEVAMTFANALTLPEESTATVAETLKRISVPNLSRVSMFRDMRLTPKVGYFYWPPFVEDRTSRRPAGLLPDLLDLIRHILGTEEWDWESVAFANLTDSLVSGKVDMVVSYALETLVRHTSSSFVPLDLPFAIGINAVTGHPEFHKPVPYSEAIKKVRTQVAAGTLRIVVVKGEVGQEYLPALIPNFEELKPFVEIEGEPIQSVMDRHLNATAPDGAHYMVVADSVSCQMAAGTKFNLLLQQPAGEFRGGFLLPPDDPDWTAFFRSAFDHLLTSKLPAVAEILRGGESETMAEKLKPYLVEQRQLREWKQRHWPEQHIGWPQAWKTPEEAAE